MSIQINSAFRGILYSTFVAFTISSQNFENSLQEKNIRTDINNQIRSATTPRHVPDYIFEVDDIPYTISGKKVEKAVLATITGRPVGNKDALANPESLEQYSTFSF